MDGINWGLAVNRTNPFAEFSEGMMRGQDMKRERERENLFAERLAYERQREERELAKEAEAERKAAALDQENRLERGLLSNMARKDPRGAQFKAMEVGQDDLARQFGQMSDEQREAAKERAGVLLAYVESLNGKSPQEVKAQIMQDADALTELGYTREQLEAFQPTPVAMAKLRTEALGIKGYLESLAPDKPISVAPGSTLVDPKTFKPLYTAPKTYAPRGGAKRAPKLPPGFILD